MENNDIVQKLEARQYPEAFALLLEQFKEKVFHLCLSLLRNETQAEDAAQDVFVKIWKALPGFVGTASLSTWIYTITRNTCLTELEKRSRHPTLSLQAPEMEPLAENLPGLQTAPPESGAEMDVATLLAELPEKYRQVITLFYLEQKAYEEVAHMLGQPLGTVKTNLFRAKQELLRIGARHLRSAAGPHPTPACSSDAAPALPGIVPALSTVCNPRLL